MFKALQEISRADQIVISTHSPHFVDMSNFETVVKITKSAQDGTNIMQAPRSLVPVDREHRIRIFSRFNTQRNEMFFAKKVILVEGNGDKYAVQMCANLLERHLDSRDIVVIETNGKPNMPYYVQVAQAFTIPFAVAYDADGREICINPIFAVR
jgi:putative ATP-dependent endonuclease of OLD family